MLLSSRRVPIGRFPFNWFPLREGRDDGYVMARAFIQFPFNWFPLREGSYLSIRPDHSFRGIGVSIQLVSPARGEGVMTAATDVFVGGWFPFNWFPLREGRST